MLMIGGRWIILLIALRTRFGVFYRTPEVLELFGGACYVICNKDIGDVVGFYSLLIRDTRIVPTQLNSRANLTFQ